MALKRGKSKKKIGSTKHLLFHITGGGLLISLILGFFFIFSSARPASSACSKPAPTTAVAWENLLRGPINGKWYHADFGQSVKLPNGKIMWVFGDTFIATAGATKSNLLVNNTALITEKGCITAITGPMVNGKETAWIKPTGTNDLPNLQDYYWPSTPFMDGSTLRMFLLHMYNDNNGFHVIGTDLASFSLLTGQPRLSSVVKTVGSASYDATPWWGAAAISNGGYNYIFGALDKREYLVFGKYYYLARVPVGQTANQGMWRYWNGSAWVTDPAAAQPVIKGEVGLGTNVSLYKKSNGEFVIIYKKGDVFGKDLYALKSRSLTGPWTDATPSLLAPIPQPSPSISERDDTYLGLGHPWIPLSSGKLLVNWSLNFTGWDAFGDHRYGIYFAEVPQP